MNESFWGDLIGDGLLLIVGIALGALTVFVLHLAGVYTPMPQSLIGLALGSFIGLMLAKRAKKRREGNDG